MHGAEYDELAGTVEDYKDQFESVSIAEPLLGEVGSDASVINEDKEHAAKAVLADALEGAGYESLEKAKEENTAFVFLGHGTSHTAKVTYSQMQTQMKELGYENVWIGTVDGEPEETAAEEVIEQIHEAGYHNVILRPLMVVAGDHANNDMASDEDDSWKSMCKQSGYFDNIRTQIMDWEELKKYRKFISNMYKKRWIVRSHDEKENIINGNDHNALCSSIWMRKSGGNRRYCERDNRGS